MTDVLTPESVPRAEVLVLLFTSNRRAYFREALESVLQQTYRDFHVLVIDDASTDGTLEMAQEYSRRMPDRVTTVSKPQRRGLADSIKLGIALTQHAPFVAFHNDDDVWFPTKLQAQMATFRESPGLGFVATDAQVIDPDSRPTGKLFSEHFGRPDVRDPARDIFWHGNRYCAASVVASRAALHDVEPYQPRIVDGCEDMYMWLVIASRLPIAWLDAPLTRYRVGAYGTITGARGRQMWRETYVLREHLLATDEAVRVAVGGVHAARAKLDDNALYLARSFLGQLDLASYVWFARQVLKRRDLRLTALLGKSTGQALFRAAADRVRLVGNDR